MALGVTTNARVSPPLGLIKRKLVSRLSLALMLLAALSAAIWWGYGRFFGAASEGRQGPRSPAVAVGVAEVVRDEFPVLLTGLGNVTPKETAVVKSQIAGQLVEINFTEGQLVKAGDVLANVDPRPYRLALAQAEGQLLKDRAQLENGERDLARYEALNKRMKDAISGQQIDTQRALVIQHKGVVAVDQAQVDQARLNLDYCSVKSLIDGRAGLRVVDVGNYVQANDPNGVAVVTRLKPITVIFTLPEDKLQSVLKKFRSGKTLEVSAYDHERSGLIAKGKLIALDNQIDASTGTVKLRAEFPNEDESLYPNQFVNAVLHVDTLKDAVLAPAAAIQRGASGPYVYLLKSDETVTVRPVTLGPVGDERVVVANGLEGGERVVVEGADKLREGAKVALPGGRSGQRPGDQRDHPSDRGERASDRGDDLNRSEHLSGHGERPKDGGRGAGKRGDKT
jgi:membrane fusion protein, multidrug efflux system